MESRETVIEKVSHYVESIHAGNWENAFKTFTTTGFLSHSQIVNVLVAAAVGSRLTRGLIATRVLEEMDADKDEHITFDEFKRLHKGSA